MLYKIVYIQAKNPKHINSISSLMDLKSAGGCMIKFERYPHVNDLIVFYMEENRRSDIAKIMVYGISEEADAKTFCQFIWSTIDQIHKDAETGRVVLGRPDNTVILP